MLYLSTLCFNLYVQTWLQERVKKLKKDHGSVELGKITVDMVIILSF